MKCPTEGCVEEKFFGLGHGTTLMGFGTDGNGHYHDPNRQTMVYQCKNGHRFDVDYRETCPVGDCEFNKWIGMTPQETIVEKVQRRMEEYATWTWEKLLNPELPRLPWDVKNRGFATYGDRKK
jgi:hypothetical protein